MRKVIVLLMVCLAISIVGCNNKGIYNEIKQNCIEGGGKAVLFGEVKTESDYYGFCTFPDGSVCDAYSFYTKVCKQADNIIKEIKVNVSDKATSNVTVEIAEEDEINKTTQQGTASSTVEIRIINDTKEV